MSPRKRQAKHLAYLALAAPHVRVSSVRMVRHSCWSFLAAIVAIAGWLQPRDDHDRFVRLFDGVTIDQWQRYSDAGQEIAASESAFSVQEGLLHCSGKGKDYWLATKHKYADFVLHLEYRVAKGTNSGIFLRVPGHERPAYTGFEVQVKDDYGDESSMKSSGGVHEVLTPMRNMSRPAGEWNQIEITCQGLLIKVVHNGFKVIDSDFSQLTEPIGKFPLAYAKLPRSGYIGLQRKEGDIWFRNLEIRELAP